MFPLLQGLQPCVFIPDRTCVFAVTLAYCVPYRFSTHTCIYKWDWGQTHVACKSHVCKRWIETFLLLLMLTTNTVFCTENWGTQCKWIFWELGGICNFHHMCWHIAQFLYAYSSCSALNGCLKIDREMLLMRTHVSFTLCSDRKSKGLSVERQVLSLLFLWASQLFHTATYAVGTL